MSSANKILLATPLYPPEIGGPAKYAAALSGQFTLAGYQTEIAVFSSVKYLPTGIRHFIYLWRLLHQGIDSIAILALDTFSVGLPAAVASLILRRPLLLRIGGDFLWEHYLERTRASITLPDFYSRPLSLNTKERIIFWLTKFILRTARCVIFTTEWQKDIWQKAYKLDENKLAVIENPLPVFEPTPPTNDKVFLWAGRMIALKNLDRLNEAFALAKQTVPEIKLEVVTNLAPQELAAKIRLAYAVILPSLSDISPNFILEAASFGKPFIVTKETGLSPRVLACGLQVEPLEVSDIAAKIIILADDEEYLKRRRALAELHSERRMTEVASDYLKKIYEVTNS
jgi:glycosyltransferase involved in cell wall biosynthesis